MSAPLLSAVIAVYNGEDFLASALTCILGQGYEPLEIIVVDDGSTDHTAALADEWAARHPDKIRVIHQANSGSAAARNTGLRAARGELIGFLDVDDLWPPGTLLALSAALASRPQAAVMQGYVRRVWLAGASGKPLYERDFVPYLAMNLGSMLFRRPLFETVGLFDEGPSQNEDTDLHLRIREAGLQIHVLERLALIYRMHARNMTRNLDYKAMDLFRVLHNSVKRRRLRGQCGSLDGLHFLSDERLAWPCISVVIPLGDAPDPSLLGPALQRTLDSIAAQNYPEIEIVFANTSNGTTDPAALTSAYSFANTRLVQLPEWDLIAALNTGALTARGDLLAWCQPGELWSCHRLRAQLGYLLPGRSDQAVTGLLRYIVDPVQSQQQGLPEHLDGFGYQDVLGTLLIKKEAFLASGGFKHTPGMSPLAALTEWFMRLKESGVRARAVPRYILFKPVGDDPAKRHLLSTGELLFLLHEEIKRKHGSPGDA